MSKATIITFGKFSVLMFKKSAVRCFKWFWNVIVSLVINKKGD